MVNYLRAADFVGGYLFIDDIENLVDQMARKARIEFAKEFALCTVRPGYSNTEHSFFSSSDDAPASFTGAIVCLGRSRSFSDCAA